MRLQFNLSEMRPKMVSFSTNCGHFPDILNQIVIQFLGNRAALLTAVEKDEGK